MENNSKCQNTSCVRKLKVLKIVIGLFLLLFLQSLLFQSCTASDTTISDANDQLQGELNQQSQDLHDQEQTPTLPDLSKCTRLEISLIYHKFTSRSNRFNPIREKLNTIKDSALLNETERQYFESVRTFSVEDPNYINKFRINSKKVG